MENPGEQFLHQKDSSLSTSEFVEHEVERKRMVGEEVSQKPADKIADWMKVIEKTHTSHRNVPQVLERIKKSYYKKYVIKPEDIPENYYKNQQRLARELGHGDIEITDEMREQLEEIVTSDQKSTLDNWIDYFTSPDADFYPTWAKYWAFTSMLKLSAFDKEKHVFAKRDKGTVAPFSDLNREALAYVVDVIVKKANQEKIPATEDNPELQKLIAGANFGKLYTYAVEKVTPTEENELLNTDGEWVKYPQGSDPGILVESLQGHGTGWCTAGEETAKVQLQGGGFYVYYSYNKDGKPTNPRAAIRMNEDSIGEVRGIAPDQNLDPYIGDVVDEKLKEFPDGNVYHKKTADMKRLTGIDKKYTNGEELTSDDLCFLYQLDSKIEGFGHNEDPRIKEIISKRDIKSDISLATGYPKEQISTTREEILSDGIKFHYGDFCLTNLHSSKNLTLPERISGDLYLNSLQSAKGLTLPKTVDGSLYLSSLQSTAGLTLPKTVRGSLDFYSLESAEGLTLPEIVGGRLDFEKLKFIEDSTLPETIGGNLNLSRLQSVKDLVLPETIGGDLYLSSLQSAKGLTLPKTVDGGLYLVNLESAEDLTLPKTVGGNLGLGRLQFAKNLTLPEAVGNNLDLNDLKFARALTLPKRVGGNLNLYSLQSAEGLTLPETIGGNLIFRNLSSAEINELRIKYPKLKIVIG